MKDVVKLDPFDEQLAKAREHIHQAVVIIEPLFGALTDAEREALLSPPEEMPGAAWEMLEEPDLLARLAPACPGFDEDQLRSDLKDAAKVAPLANRVQYLNRLIGDAHRSRLSSAFAAGLAVYTVAKAGVARDATLQPLVKPFQDMYANRKKPAKKGAAPEPTATPPEPGKS